MKVGIVGAGAVGSASLLALVMRGPPACEIVVVDKNTARAKGVVADLQYGATLSLPSVLGRTGVSRILEPEMSAAERAGLERSAETLRQASAKLAA